MSQVLRIATRKSALALWQAEFVKSQLQHHHPDLTIELLPLTSRGDQILDIPLAKVGGKGLFVKELETALLDGRADIAVHSLKDVPVDLTTPFSLPVIMERDDPRDAFVSSGYASLEELPEGAVVGTSSLRRESQIRARFPKLKVKPLRGNLDTRLGKLDRGEYDAIVLAAAGLRRLGLQNRIRGLLEPEISLPSAGQGALGIEILESRSDLAEWLQPLSCPETTACAIAERAVSRVLGGSCQVPLAAYAQVDDGWLTVQALVAEPDGTKIIRSHRSGQASDALQLGETAARELLAQGADAILARLLPPTA